MEDKYKTILLDFVNVESIQMTGREARYLGKVEEILSNIDVTLSYRKNVEEGKFEGEYKIEDDKEGFQPLHKITLVPPPRYASLSFDPRNDLSVHYDFSENDDLKVTLGGRHEEMLYEIEIKRH